MITQSSRKPGSLTSKEYWFGVWEHTPPRHMNSNHHYDREVIAAFAQAGRLVTCYRPRIIEIGCGNSMWLPYLAQSFGWTVVGIDYSERGCYLAERNLIAAGVTGEIIQRDLLQDNADLFGQYDMLYSAGFVEHFNNPDTIVRLMTKFLKPEGIMVTTIPNLYNLAAFIRKLVSPKNLARHRSISLSDMHSYHEAAGLLTVSVSYAGFGGDVTPDRIHDGDSNWCKSIRKRLLLLAYRPTFLVASRSVQLVRRVSDVCGVRIPRTRGLSAAIIYVGRKISTS